MKKRKPFDSVKQRTAELPKDVAKKPAKAQSELASGKKVASALSLKVKYLFRN